MEKLFITLFVIAPFLAFGSHSFAHSKHTEQEQAEEKKSVGTADEPVKAAKDDEPVEEIEDIEVVKPAKESAERKPEGALDLIGKFHPMVAHFPIAWLFLLIMLDIIAFGFSRREWGRAGLYIHLLTIASYLPAAVTGFLRYAHVEAEGGRIHELAEAHRNFMIFSLILCLAALGIKLWQKNQPVGFLRWIYLAILFSSGLIIVFGAHLGGKLVFGESYLPF
ncbi:MAG: hypothetical protein Kow0090_13240 [Myxococcota bacterium]